MNKTSDLPSIFFGYRYHESRDSHQLFYTCVGCGHRYCYYSENDIVGFIYSKDSRLIVCNDCDNDPDSYYCDYSLHKLC